MKGIVQVKLLLLADSKIRIEVEDTGVGIKEEEIELLFQKFSQGEEAIIKRIEGSEYGTGLGLQISKMLIELMGGRIEVRLNLKTKRS